MSIFSEQLTKLMKQHNMTDEQLAEMVDVNRTTISRWRTGERSPKMETLPEIAQIFNVSPQFFFTDQATDADFIEYYRHLNSEQKEATIAYVKNLLNETK